jgi:hypothetical protein
MAKLHKRSVQEALNATVGGIWTVNTAATADANTDVTDTEHLALASTTATLGVYAAVEIYFNFAATEVDIVVAKDLVIPKNTLTFLTVPRGLGNTVYFSYLSTSSDTGAVKTVEI